MQSVRLRYRLLLIGLLPLIAAAVYFSGQTYDPALIDFGPEDINGTSGPGLPDDQELLRSFPEVAGFRQSGEARRYTRENLYEHVNGHAEYFISAGFAGLTVAEYTSAGEGAEVQAEIFDMGSDMQAFGVLSDESGTDAAPLDLGTLGYRTSVGVNFILGRYYVKISAARPKTDVLLFAKELSGMLPHARGSFGAFSKFPGLGKVERTRYVKESYRGIDFLENVIEREYSVGDQTITVALLTGGKQEMQALHASFLDYFRDYGIPFEKVGRNGEEAYRVKDKYEGNWFLLPGDDATFCIFGSEDEKVLRHFVQG
jgi:hypothetical protein